MGCLGYACCDEQGILLGYCVLYVMISCFCYITYLMNSSLLTSKILDMDPKEDSKLITLK